MASREQRHQHLVNHLVLADDDLAELGKDSLTPEGDPVGGRGDVWLHQWVSA